MQLILQRRANTADLAPHGASLCVSLDLEVLNGGCIAGAAVGSVEAQQN